MPQNTVGQSEGTIFDDVYITMLEKMAYLLIPLINEVFGTNYTLETECVSLKNEHITLNGKIITDALVRVANHLYHIECQSTPDGTMVVRMLEYDFSVALAQAYQTGNFTEMNFPLSAVIYLRKPTDMADELKLKLNFSYGQSIEYKVPVIKVQDYSLEEIFSRKLWLFLPYYLMRYESEFKTIDKNPESVELLKQELRKIAANWLESEALQVRPDGYVDMVKLIKKIAYYLLRKQREAQKEVRKIMGGKVLPLPSERLIRWGEKRGIKLGKKQGFKLGEQRGRMETILSNVKTLMSNLKWTAQEAMDNLQIPVKEREDILAKI